MSAVDPWPFIEIDDVIALHSDAMVKYGGQDSQPKPGCVDSSVHGAVTAAMYADDEPDLLSAVAYLLFYLAKNHCFVDGNKRVAWAAAIRTLEINGFRVQGEELEAASLVERVASGDVDVEFVIRWFGSPGRLCADDSPLSRPSPQTS